MVMKDVRGVSVVWVLQLLPIETPSNEWITISYTDDAEPMYYISI